MVLNSLIIYFLEVLMKKYLIILVLIQVIAILMSGCQSTHQNSTSQKSRIVHAKIVLEEIYYGGNDIGEEWKFNFNMDGRAINREELKLEYNHFNSLNWEIFNGETIVKGDSIGIIFSIEEIDPIKNDKSNGIIYLYINEDNEIEIPVAEDTLISNITISIKGISCTVPIPQGSARLKLKFRVEIS